MTVVRSSTPPLSAVVRPSLVFWGLVAAFAGSVWLCLDGAPVDPGVSTFLLVAVGWVLSLTLHEFAHAAVAYVGGDRAVVGQGYLQLDPRQYTDPGLSLLFPLLIVALGGIGLPGGAVWLRPGALRSDGWRSAVSLAGPAVNVVCALACGLALTRLSATEQPVLVAAVSFLGLLQVTAAVFNLLPVPGLDGYGALEPHLPTAVRDLLEPLRRRALLLIIVLFLFVPGVGELLWELIDRVLRVAGIDLDAARLGWALFRFWTR